MAAFSNSTRRLCFLLAMAFALAVGLPCAWAAEAPGEVRLSDEEGLALAATLYNRGEREAAERVYGLLLQSGQPEISVEAAFLLSQIYVSREDYNQAIALLTGILNRFPGLARVRLELARAYFLNENWDDARFHFELVKGGQNIPPGVAANVDMFLREIRRKKNWSLEVGFGYVPDSNLNQASGITEECIDTSMGLLCRAVDGKKSGHGARLNVTGNYYWKLSQNVGIRSTLGLYLTEYGRGEYDDYILYAAGGPRILFGNSEASLQATFQRRVYGGESYGESPGLRFDMQNDFGRFILASGASFRQNNYAREAVDAALQGNEYRAYLMPRFIVTSRSYVQAGLDYTRDETALDPYGSDRRRFSLGGYYFFKHGFSLFVEGGLTRADYHAGQWYVTDDYRLDYTRRQDLIKEATVELSTNIWEGLGMRPTLQYTYIRQGSNIWSHEYDRHRINLLTTFRF
ncbi:MAG: surface lipoprotein assembly modifier [Candidatus Adiutrix sp.]|jgi:hypothetical protein|nr:surface lipoprotein assembly modifier [Candidatus Adiutrix sp.]